MTSKPKIDKDKPKNRGNAGKGRPKGAPNKATADIKAVAQQYGQEAIETLVKLMRTAESEQTRAIASDKLLDRGYGKPRQTIESESNININFADERQKLSDRVASWAAARAAEAGDSSVH